MNLTEESLKELINNNLFAVSHMGNIELYDIYVIEHGRYLKLIHRKNDVMDKIGFITMYTLVNDNVTVRYKGKTCVELSFENTGLTLTLLDGEYASTVIKALKEYVKLPF